MSGLIRTDLLVFGGVLLLAILRERDNNSLGCHACPDVIALPHVSSFKTRNDRFVDHNKSFVRTRAAARIDCLQTICVIFRISHSPYRIVVVSFRTRVHCITWDDLRPGRKPAHVSKSRKVLQNLADKRGGRPAPKQKNYFVVYLLTYVRVTYVHCENV